MEHAGDRIIDELLVLRCQEGDRECFDLLVRRWQRRLWRYARRLTGTEDAAWDVMQETWIAVLGKIRTLNDPAWFPAWACRIVRNQCANYGRTRNRQMRAGEDWAECRRMAEPSRQEDPADMVQEALGRMSPERQELLTLRYGQGLNIVEMAVVLGIPPGTVKSRLHYAREELRRRLEGDGS